VGFASAIADFQVWIFLDKERPVGFLTSGYARPFAIILSTLPAGES
jgi:hypothetical protein